MRFVSELILYIVQCSGLRDQAVMAERPAFELEPYRLLTVSVRIKRR